ncbi:MAG: hypothetical protein COV99_05330 [Bacteroidetes bacterium CG12_big_fil_rev_8_21_14_0_65_60_17]|nr:MAG: hypothetical protein COV99_05330 [Bacteroidetes bacterium CG12_big_fil_rev_8_21_14_0_65_60_17]
MLTAMLDAGMAVLIWLVQIIIYPSFRTQRVEGFAFWHAAYTQRMGYIVGPLMLFQATFHVVAWRGVLLEHGLMSGPFAVQSLSLLLIMAAWLVTAFVSVPCHRALGTTGYSSYMIERLIQTNWWRTGLWTAVAALDLM